MRNIELVEGEYYHIYNRGVDKRNVTSDIFDSNRFILAIEEFNTLEPIGSLYAISHEKGNIVKSKKGQQSLVDIICYCLNPNHYHMVLKQNVKDGISKFMHRVSTGYTKYFNERYERSGSLFQGTFKAQHIAGNNYLLHLSAYVNLNYSLHRVDSNLVRSSWCQYSGECLGKDKHNLKCDTHLILNQFSNQDEYIKFAIGSIKETAKAREESKLFDNMLIDNNL